MLHVGVDGSEIRMIGQETAKILAYADNRRSAVRSHIQQPKNLLPWRFSRGLERRHRVWIGVQLISCDSFIETFAVRHEIREQPFEKPKAVTARKAFVRGQYLIGERNGGSFTL